MPFNPINYGNIAAQGENILAARQRRDPNSMQNQLLAAQLQNAQNPGNIVDVGKTNPRDFTAESIQEARRTGDMSKLVRYNAPRQPIRVDAGDAWEIYDVDPVTRQPALLKRIPKELGPDQTGDYFRNQANQRGIGGLEADLGIDLRAHQEPGGGLGGYNPSTVPSKASIASDVTTAEETAKEDVKEKVTKKKNEKAYATYQVAQANLEKALGKTTTGFFAGKVPPIGAMAQIAENAQKIIFPAVKSLVREAGEGVFTDRDAIDVQAMLPTRETHPDALPMVMYQINTYVASKLGQSLPPLPDGAIERPPQIAQDDPRWHQLSNQEKLALIEAYEAKK